MVRNSEKAKYLVEHILGCLEVQVEISDIIAQSPHKVLVQISVDINQIIQLNFLIQEELHSQSNQLDISNQLDVSKAGLARRSTRYLEAD